MWMILWTRLVTFCVQCQLPGPIPGELNLTSAVRDVVTTPTLPMLRAIMETSLLDDVYQEDPTTTSLERLMANLTSHSRAAFVISGTMGNQVALRTHLTQPPYAILCDSRSHIIHWEAGGIASLCGAMVQGVSPENGAYLTLEDIQRKAVLSDDVHMCPTRVISLENTVSGLIHPLSEIRRISKWARQNDVRLHLDGARLWEAVAAGGGSLADYTKCFDSASLDFSKGLGAPMGAVIVGNSDFIARAKRIRKGFGGGMRQAGVLTSAARAAVEGFYEGREPGEKLRFSHALARQVAGIWVRKGGKLGRPTQTNLVWANLKEAAVSPDEFRAIGERHGVKVDGSRIVLHYQISDEGIRRLESTFGEVLCKG